jgi:hypothetical protein
VYCEAGEKEKEEGVGRQMIAKYIVMLLAMSVPTIAAELQFVHGKITPAGRVRKGHRSASSSLASRR